MNKSEITITHPNGSQLIIQLNQDGFRYREVTPFRKMTSATALPEGAADAIREAMGSKINKAPIRQVTGAMLPPYLQTVPADTVMIERHDFTPHPTDHERCAVCGMTAVEHGSAPAIPAAECHHRPDQWIDLGHIKDNAGNPIQERVRYCLTCKAYQYQSEPNDYWHTPEED